MSYVLSDLIWVQTDCMNVISRRTVARKLNASCADNTNTIINPLAYKYDCYILDGHRPSQTLVQTVSKGYQQMAKCGWQVVS